LEALKIKNYDSELFNNQLSYLSNLSKNMYLYNDLKETNIYEKSPFEVIQDMGTNIEYKNLFKDLIKTVSYDDLRASREYLNVSPSEFNNILPENAIDEDFHKYYPQKERYSNFDLLLERSLQLILPKPTSEKKKIENRINVSFSLLDSFGFWNERRKNYESGSFSFDSQHAAVAIYNNAFISEDRRFCMKAKCIFNYFKIPIIVFYLKDDNIKIYEYIRKIT
jgi:hypothetical protein